MTTCTATDLWPPAEIVISTGDLRLTPVAEDDLCELVDLALSGIHAEGFMPFAVPWTLTTAEEMPRTYATWFYGTRAQFTRDSCGLEFTVRRDGEVVGVQGYHVSDYPVTRTAETGSWLGLRFQGQGIGTRMRRAICTLLFDELGAEEVTSAAFVDNPASLAVSRKLGYRPNGAVRLNRLGNLAINQRLVLDRADFVRSEDVEVAGTEPLRRFLGLA